LPNLRRLRLFGARVCVKRSGKRKAKLDRHDFTGIFLGYTATMANIVYLVGVRSSPLEEDTRYHGEGV